jgi:hypothetical protein
MLTMVRISSTVTWPSPPQSPIQGGRETVAVGVGIAVAVRVGVSVAVNVAVTV